MTTAWALEEVQWHVFHSAKTKPCKLQQLINISHGKQCIPQPTQVPHRCSNKEQGIAFADMQD